MKYKNCSQQKTLLHCISMNQQKFFFLPKVLGVGKLTIKAEIISQKVTLLVRIMQVIG